MASFSTLYRFAYHVTPLHALKGIWERRALLSKEDAPQSRPTTGHIDLGLGFGGFVHFYLASEDRIFDLPILRAQLGPSRRPPFPHVALELPTGPLVDSASVICNWNLAVSRPKTAGVRGGNWSRGTNPARIVEHWNTFRSSDPLLTAARGRFNDPYLVPTLTGSQISQNLRLLGRAPRRMPELLLRAPVGLARFSRLLVFSQDDFVTAQLLGPDPLPAAQYHYPGYASEVVPTETRRRIEAYFAAPGRAPVPEFDFDAVRPRA